MLPQMVTKPRAARGPNSVDTIDRSRTPPEISIVMEHPTAATVLFLCSATTANDQIIDQVKERLVTLRKIRELGRPIVHLEINIGCPLALPRRSQLVVPDSLQIGRLASGTTT